ncbi:hypothetical protein TPA0908_02540 [Micromonospora sp. AKA38]|nr:hypothetical protein TPA0908_02540 [Micromonospora sp. AKA38]
MGSNDVDETHLHCTAQSIEPPKAAAATIQPTIRAMTQTSRRAAITVTSTVIPGAVNVPAL